MSPVNTPDYFWAHVPSWAWPVIVVGILACFAAFIMTFIAQAMKASETVAKLFGGFGRRIYDQSGRRVLERLDERADRLECAAAYIVDDTDWHTEADILLAEVCPGVTRLLPSRVPFTEFTKRWREGWRPPAYQED